MKPTDEERRKVAARLRGLDVADLGDGHGIIDTPEEAGALFSRILEAANDYRPGLHYATSHFAARAPVELFAELIEPQERTCRVVPDGCMGRCSACGEDVFADPNHRGGYCPVCGAKVVEE